MNEMTSCAYCGKKFTKTAKPFIPVKSNQAFHWKCYMKVIRANEDTDLVYEESEERIRQL